MKKIIFIGGTGQNVLHYFSIMYLLGLVEEPFHAVVIDSDELIDSLAVLRDFFSILQATTSDDQEFPKIESVKIKTIGNDTKVFEVLTGLGKDPNIEDENPVSAFFSKDTLTQDLLNGLFARPVLSSLFIGNTNLNAYLKATSDPTVVVVCSVIGGTGGGLFLPIIDKLTGLNSNISLRAVIFGQYFEPDPQKIKDADSRFPSNQSLVLRSIEEFDLISNIGVKVHSYHIIFPEKENIIKRETKDENKGLLSLPNQESHPYWQGLSALYSRLTDTVGDIPGGIPSREIVETKATFTVDSAKLKLKTAHSYINTLLNYKIIKNLSTDYFFDSIFGDKLRKLVIGFWNIASRKEGKDKVSVFPGLLHDELNTLWMGSLKPIFPESITSVLTPNDFKANNNMWHKPPEIAQIKLEPYSSAQETAKKAAALILYDIMRGSK